MSKRLKFLLFTLFVLVSAPALVLAQDTGAPDWTQVGVSVVGALAGCAALTAAMVYVLRGLFNKIPNSYWPFIAIALGQGADALVAYFNNGSYNPIFGTIAGMASVWIHEAITKHGERLLTSGGRIGKALLVAGSILLLPAPIHAQTFEALTNPNVVAGASYLTEAPVSSAGFDLSRTHFLLTANVAGVKMGTLPLYLGGVGIDLRTIDESFGEISGVGLSVPLVSYYFKGDQFLAQVGWATDLTGDPKSKAFYVGVGFSLTGPNQMAAKRAAKK